MRYLLLLVSCVFLSCFSCKDPEPRKPINKKTGSFLKESVDRTKKLLEQENNIIKNYIKNDSLHTYINSNHGFYFSYLKKDTTQTKTPQFGNVVRYTYSISDLNNQLIYPKTEIGVKSYQVDQENIIEGLRKGIKLMHKNETIKCILPSQIAYGYKGDRKKITPNTPILLEIDLLEINTNKQP